MSFIPQELIDEILSYVPSDDKQGRQSLRNCSLIAKSWTNPSRRRLFETVQIRNTTFRRWLDTIPPANTELLRHVRSLSYIVDNVVPGTDWEPGGRVDVLRDYLPSFHCLQHLSLSSVHIPSDISQQIEIFSAFRDGLSRLSLRRCTVTINALVTLINFFPGLDRLDLHHIMRNTDGEPASTLLSRCRGLQESELVVIRPGTKEVDILSSITSASIQKISLTYWRPGRISSQQNSDIDWEVFDGPLCRLVDLSRHTRELEVEFRIVGTGDMRAEVTVIANSLVNFREKGRIRVVRVGPGGNERVVYPTRR